MPKHNRPQASGHEYMKARLVSTLCFGLMAAAAALAPNARAADSLSTLAQQAIDNFKQKDPSVERFFNDSAGYAVFPSVGEGGLIIGGAHGKGLVYERGKPVGEATVSKASIGAQVGGQSFSEIIFFQTPQALQDFKAGHYELNAAVSAVVAAEGAAQTANYSQGVAVFTMPKSGVMAQAAIGGQKFSYKPLSQQQ
jgi:lipid-binding SYLF domain-containing protein